MLFDLTLLDLMLHDIMLLDLILLDMMLLDLKLLDLCYLIYATLFCTMKIFSFYFIHVPQLVKCENFYCSYVCVYLILASV